MTEHSTRIKFDTGDELRALTFSANGEYLVTGHYYKVRVWRGKRCEATMEAWRVGCVAVSNDGRWIAAGAMFGEIFVWDASKTYQEVFSNDTDSKTVPSVDFSPDSKRLVSSGMRRTTIWDVHTGKQIQTLTDDRWVLTAKYSARGDRIATATRDHVQVWDSNDGSLLVSVPVDMGHWLNTCLVWSNDRLFVTSNGGIEELDVSTGSTVSKWRASDIRSIALPKHGKFIVYTTECTVTLWDTLTRCEIGQIQHPERIRCVAISPDGCSIVIGELGGKVAVESLSDIMDSLPSSRLHESTLQELVIQIGATALDAWRNDQLERAEAILDTVIATSSIQSHHALASRALIRARLKRWDDALTDAEMAVDAQPSVIGYIAKSIAHAGKGDRYQAYHHCDIAIERFHSDHVAFLLVKAIIIFMTGEHLDAISCMDNLIAVNPTISIFYVVQAYMLVLCGNSYMENGNYEDATQFFARAQIQLRLHSSRSLFLVSLITGWKFDDLHVMICQRRCEVLYSTGYILAAGKSLLELVCTLENEVYAAEAIVKWISDFTQQCLTTPGSETASIGTPNADGLMLRASLLKEWVKATLVRRSWRDALTNAVGFVVPRFAIYRTICERLDAIARITEAAECLLEMTNEISQETDEQAKWIFDFKHQLSWKLEECGDVAMSARQHDDAVVQYSTALYLDCEPLEGLFGKRSKARANMGLWKDAIDDANQVILLDPSSPLGYERKYAASRGAGCYGDAEVAFEAMLSKMSESSDTELRERSRRYVKPTVTEAAIREAIQGAIRNSPPVLINTHSGRLLDKPGQASSFESRPIFHELVASTTTWIDLPRIQDEVERYYLYATFSHKWKENEPSYQDVVHLVVYELEESPTYLKLQKFCEIVQEAGLNWAWSDTCCINKSDSAVLQKALVSMFQWYQGSSLTVVLLCDVPLRRLIDSIWNSRAWTLQEYHASRVVRFYNKDWTLYKNLDVLNHKESPEVIAEMEEATGISAQALMALRQGLEDIREKLRLASTRQAAEVEDTAYSLLGIFSLSMSIEYGEGDRALGRLLARLLASSGDTSILAWTGSSGGFNSCLPAKITVFSQSATSHIPPATASADMDTAIARLRRASPNRALLARLYDRLNELPVPHFNGQRMRLPSIVFKLGPLSVVRRRSERVFRALTSALGIVEITSNDDLSCFKSLALVHPWIDFLLDRQPVGSVVETLPKRQSLNGVIGTIQEGGMEDRSPLTNEPPTLLGPEVTSVDPKTRTPRRFPRLGLFGRRSGTRPEDTARFASDAQSLRPPSTVLETDKQMRALQLMARLKRPFGALLLTPDAGNVAAYKRVAAGTLITVQVKEMTPALLEKLIRSVDVLDVL